MNKVHLVGRMARDINVSYTTGENAMAIGKFSIAVQRRFKNSQGQYEADFPSCTAFGKNCEFIQKYFKKGDLIGITGHIQTSNYTNKEGIKVYTTDVIIDEVEFVGGKSNNNTETNPIVNDGFINVPEGSPEEEDLPW